MAAPRLYTDAQRLAIYSLHEQGIGSPEISRRAASGELASCERFSIPPSTVRAICGAIDRERNADRIDSFEAVLAELDRTDLPNRALVVLRRELHRIEAKDGRALSLKELERTAAIGLAADELEQKARKRLARERRAAPEPKLDPTAGTEELLRRLEQDGGLRAEA